jgi:hypothetical protein
MSPSISGRPREPSAAQRCASEIWRLYRSAFNYELQITMSEEERDVNEVLEALTGKGDPLGCSTIRLHIRYNGDS